MGLIAFIISTLVTGIIVGALGRLALPGPTPLSIGMTIAVGIGGAFVGGIVGQMLSAGAILVLILQVLAAAGIIYLMKRRGATT